MSEAKKAQLDHPVQDLIARRWSPVLLSPDPIAPQVLRSLLEAARWAASAYNEQPWRFLVAQRENEAEFEKMLSCLMEGNQTWAKNAPVLMLTAVSLNHAKTGEPNKSAEHDLGLAVGNLTLEATAHGLSVHQMGGIRPGLARELYGVPDDFRVVTGLAIGKPVTDGPEDLMRRDTTPRTRLPQSEFVFSGEFGRTLTD